MHSHRFESLHQPGDKVIVGGDIEAVVERITFGRGRTQPLIDVEWWSNGALTTQTFHEEDVQKLKK